MAPGAQSLLLLPEALRLGEFTLRHDCEPDAPFLERLYMSVRWPELEPTGWSDDAKVSFLKSQFVLQYRHYRTHYGGAEFGILEWRSGPVGRLYLFRGAKDIRIVDISLLPEVRNRGIGATLLTAVLDQAESEGKSVSLHVDKFNPAQRLYLRLGFEAAGESGPDWLMIRPAPKANVASE